MKPVIISPDGSKATDECGHEWSVGDIAFVLQEVPGDSCPKSFYKFQTFPITRFGRDEKEGNLLLAGGRFDFGIAAKRCAKVKENTNPYPQCRWRENDSPIVKALLASYKF